MTDRHLIDEDELERRLAAARYDGYREGRAYGKSVLLPEDKVLDLRRRALAPLLGALAVGAHRETTVIAAESIDRLADQVLRLQSVVKSGGSLPGGDAGKEER